MKKFHANKAGVSNTRRRRRTKQQQPQPTSPAQSPRIFDSKEKWNAYYEERRSNTSSYESETTDTESSGDERDNDEDDRKTQSNSTSQRSSLNVSVQQSMF